MKPIIIILFCLSSIAGAQETNLVHVPDTLTSRYMFTMSKLFSADGLAGAVHYVTFVGSPSRNLTFTFRGDSLVTSGDLALDSAAMKFNEFVSEQYSQRIAELKLELRNQKRLVRMLKLQVESLRKQK